MPKKGEALDKAISKHGAKQTESNGQSKRSIDKQLNKEPLNNKKDIEIGIFLDWFNEVVNPRCILDMFLDVINLIVVLKYRF